MKYKINTDYKLKEMVSYAYTHSPFYQRKLQSMDVSLEELIQDWEKVPIIQKRELMYTQDSVVPYEYLTQLGLGEIYASNTSGSTGQCLTIYWNHWDMAKSMMPLWLYRKKYYGITPTDRYCYFYTLRNIGRADPEWETHKTGMGFSKQNLTWEKLEWIYEKMYAHQPAWMLLQPSIAISLGKYVLESGVEGINSLKYIELTGEMFTERNQKFLEAAFQVPVRSQYGCNEANSIAYQCPCGNLHIMEANVHVDIIRDGRSVPEGEEGNIVITSKHNRVMPFIKYDIGDCGMLLDKPCSCGNKGKVLKLTKGRSNDLILLEKEEECSVYEFIRAFRCIEKSIDGTLYQYQIIQKSYYGFEVHLVTDERKEVIEQLFKANIQNKTLQKADYSFILHDCLLPEEDCGKLRMFRREIAE